LYIREKRVETRYDVRLPIHGQAPRYLADHLSPAFDEPTNRFKQFPKTILLSFY